MAGDDNHDPSAPKMKKFSTDFGLSKWWGEWQIHFFFVFTITMHSHSTFSDQNQFCLEREKAKKIREKIGRKGKSACAQRGIK